MKHFLYKQHVLSVPVLVALSVLIAIGAALGDDARTTGSTFELTWMTIDAGGGDASGNGFLLRSTIGQVDAGILTDGDFVLHGGFWPGPFGVTSTCPQDVTNDGTVNVLDLINLLGGWGANPGHPGDLDGDGIVGVEDLLQLLGAWGDCPGTEDA